MTLTRRAFATTLATALGGSVAPLPSALRQRPRPSPSQLSWQRDELALFLHFGVNTFTDREWGDGREDPAVFNPTALDARQWARAGREAGARALILTAKHHDGFCLWPSGLTTHSVARSPWRGRAGDVVREFTDACRREGLRAGLYLSPWDRNAPVYGDSPRYNDFYCAQLTELLTHYGPIAEMWFDGANGEGPNGRRQAYDWPRVFGLVRRLQAPAGMVSAPRPDVRWGGNETGAAGDPKWATLDPPAVPYPGASGDGVIAALQHGDPYGSVWRPGETDTSIRPGCFYHPAEDERVRPVDQLADIWFTSVGRNSKLLLNVPPTREGLLHATDMARLAGLRAHLTALFADDFAAGRPVDWRVTGARSAAAEVDLGRTVTVGVTRLEEDITGGQCVARYAVLGTEGDGAAWRELARGTTVGHRKLDRFEPATVRRVRGEVQDAVVTPRRLRIGLYRGA